MLQQLLQNNISFIYFTAARQSLQGGGGTQTKSSTNVEPSHLPGLIQKRKTKKATTARTEKKNTNSGFMGKLGIPLAWSPGKM